MGPETIAFSPTPTKFCIVLVPRSQQEPELAEMMKEDQIWFSYNPPPQPPSEYYGFIIDISL